MDRFHGTTSDREIDASRFSCLLLRPRETARFPIATCIHFIALRFVSRTVASGGKITAGSTESCPGPGTTSWVGHAIFVVVLQVASGGWFFHAKHFLYDSSALLDGPLSPGARCIR